MIGFCKYRSIAVNLICVSVIIIGTVSCGISESVVVPLSEMKIEDKRFLDTNTAATTFYFGLFNTDGYDRYSGTVFQDMMYRMTAEQSIMNDGKPIEYFEGVVQKKGLHVIYQLNGIYTSEPFLRSVSQNSDTTLSSDSTALALQKPTPAPFPQKATPALPGLSKPLTKDEVTTKKKEVQSSKRAVSKIDERLIIVACFRESYFEEYMLRPFENELSEIDYYRAKGWVRVYLVDFPGYRIYEAQEVFPDAWRANYGE